MSTSEQSPIFVVGAPRSGTTLLARTLGLHPEVLSPGETHFFEDVWSRRNELGDLDGGEGIALGVDRVLTLFDRYGMRDGQSLVDQVVERDALISEVKSNGGGFDALYFCFLNSLTKSQGKSRSCDDTPKHLFYLPTIFELFPSAKVLCCVRDPRDYLCSYKNYWRKSTESSRIRALYHPILTSLVWRSSAKRIRRAVEEYEPDQVTMVQYESFVHNSEAVLHRLCNFLNIDFYSEMLLIDAENSSFDVSSSGIFTTSVGRWPTCLSPEEVWWVQSLNKDAMITLGYRNELTRPNLLRLLFFALSALVAFPRALYANRHKRGPTLKYLVQRLRAI